MGNHTKWALVVFLCVGLVLATVVSMSAQKAGGGPITRPYWWTVTFEPNDDGTMPVFSAGTIDGLSDAAEVQVEYVLPRDRNAKPYTFFRVTVHPWAEGQWLGFRDLMPDSWAIQADRKQICGYPDFGVDGFALTGGSPLECGAGDHYSSLRFLSGSSDVGHRHPDQSASYFYSWASLDIRAGLDFEAVNEGEHLHGVTLAPSVLPKPCGTTFAGVSGGYVPDPDGEITVTRLGPDTWKVSVEAAAYFTEMREATPVSNRKGGITCPGPIYGGTVKTKPIKTVSVWTRRLK